MSKSRFFIEISTFFIALGFVMGHQPISIFADTKAGIFCRMETGRTDTAYRYDLDLMMERWLNQ